MDMNRPQLGTSEALGRRHSDGSAPQSNMPISPGQAQNLDFPHPHFALIYIDHNGKLQVEASPSIAGCGGAIFTPDVTDRFMGMAIPHPQSSMQFHPNPPPSSPSPWSVQPVPAWPQTGQTRPAELIPCEWQSNNHRRKRRDTKRTGMRRPPPKSASPPPTPPPGRTILRVGNRDLLRRYYEKAFEDFQQLNCRAIAKSYIKLVEPRKQVHFPYNGRKVISGVSHRVDPELTKPGWWPDGVLHREPDHLLKKDRLLLLVHILCELKDSHGVTADKLREAGQDVRRQITPANRLQVLDEIYFVRQMEEQFLDGDIDANTLVQVTQTHLPEAIYQNHELSTRIYAAPLSINSDQDGHDPGNSSIISSSQIDELEHIPLLQQGGQVPLSPATSASSGPQSPTAGYGTYPVDLAPPMLPQESPSAPKSMAADPNYYPGYYGPQFVAAEKGGGYWPGVPNVPQYGY